MKVHIETDNMGPGYEAQVGNVYQVRGGRGAAKGHMSIIFAVTEPKQDKYGCTSGRDALVVIVDRDGDVRGCTSYAMHYFEDKAPIAFVDGLDDISLVMRSI